MAAARRHSTCNLSKSCSRKCNRGLQPALYIRGHASRRRHFSGNGEDHTAEQPGYKPLQMPRTHRKICRNSLNPPPASTSKSNGKCANRHRNKKSAFSQCRQFWSKLKLPRRFLLNDLWIHEVTIIHDNVGLGFWPFLVYIHHPGRFIAHFVFLPHQFLFAKLALVSFQCT